MTKSNFSHQTIILKLFSNIYFLFKTIQWFLDLNFKILKTLNRFIFRPHVIHQNDAIDLNFQMYMTTTANNALVLVISVNFAKFSVKRRAIWRHFEDSNEIVGLNGLKIQIPDEFFLQHGPVWTYLIANISPVFMIFHRKTSFRTLGVKIKLRAKLSNLQTLFSD